MPVKERIDHIFLTVPDHEMFNEVLNVVLDAMQSEYGVFGYIDEEGALVVPSMTRHIWVKCQVEYKTLRFPRESWGHSSWARAIREKAPNFTNDSSTLTPAGHIEIRRHISLPILFQGEVIGLFQVANKKSDYTETDVGLLKTIADHVSAILKIRLQRDWKEMELQESEIRYRRLFESAKDGILILNAETGMILDVNPFLVELLGYKREAFLNKKVWELGTFKDIISNQRRFEELRQNSYVRYEDLPLETAFGQQIDVEFVSNVYLVKNNNVIQCNIRDISARKKLEAQLRQSQKMEAVGQLAGGIAHDFNNILSAIIGYGHVTLTKMAKDDPLRLNIEQMLAASDRAAELTRSILAFSRKQILERKPVDLNELVLKVEKFLKRLIGEDISVEISPGNDQIYVLADSGQIEQLLMNLATNARDAMPEGGLLNIETSATELDDRFIKEHGYGNPGKFALISVSDTGMGMDEETRKRIFEPFFTTKEAGKGTGLGLAMVYGIVKQHDGYINVYSEPEKGTTFRIYLPLIASEAGEEKMKVDAEFPERGCETILLAEDDEFVRELTISVLQEFGYEVIVAVDGEDAVKQFRENRERVRLLLFDLIMPKKSGKEAYDEIRAMNPDVRIIFSSGYTPDIIRQKGLIEDGISIISKPFAPSDLLKKIRSVLDG